MMSITKWHNILRTMLISGSVASIASAIALSLLGKSELNRFAAPLNGPSQWIWGRHAPYMNRLSFRYTFVGYTIHHAASIFWAIGYEGIRRCLRSPETTSAVLAPAVVTAVAAYTVDFYLIPKRLTPGFENRLSKRSLLFVYGAFALGLAAPALLARNRKFRPNQG